MIPSVTSIHGSLVQTFQQSGELEDETNVDTLLFNCRRVKNSEDVRQILPSLVKALSSFTEKQVRHFQEQVIPLLLRFAEIKEQLALSLMLANWYVTNQSAETRLSGSLQAMHYFAKSIQVGNFNNDLSVKEIHQQTSRLFLGLIDEKQQEKIQKALNALANVTGEDFHAFEIFEYRIDQFHCLPHFCTQLQDFDVLKTLFTIGTKSLNAVPLERLEKYAGSSEKIAEGLRLTRTLPKQYITEKYWEALANYRSVFETIDFSKKLTVEEIRSFQNKATESFRAFFKMLIDDALILLGPPPSLYQKRLHQPPCSFEILAMGSLGRQEACPYSDLEFMIIIENEEASDYFKRLVQVLEIQIASLGETSTDNPVFTCIHQKNPSGLHIDSSPSLNLKLIQTASTMARLQTNPITEFQTIEYTALRTTSLYASEGAHSLFGSYQIALKESLDSCREERAYEFFVWHYADYQENWKQPFNQGVVNIKKQFVVPLYHLLGDMALYFGISETNTLDIIEELVKRGCFTKESGNLLQECIAVLYAMRMRLHLYYGEQKEEGACNCNLQFLTLTKNEIALLEKTYWLVLQPLYGCLGSILKKLETSGTRASDFKTLFKNIDLIPIIFQDKFFDLPELLVKQIALHYCQIKAPLETHLYYFRALSKQPQESLRECYFSILEKNLNQEDKPTILRILLDVPNQSGLRLVFNRELQQLEATLHEITDKLQDGNEMVVITASSFTIPRYLKPRIKILEGVNIRKMYPESAHEVCRLEYESHDLHFKQKPSNPLMEYAIHNLTSRIAGKLTPPNLLVRFDVYTTQGQKSYPVLISKTIPGKNLSEGWKEVRPNANYTWNLLCAILTRPGDGRFENYIHDENGNLFCVDNDCSFVELASNHYFSKNQFCSALFSIQPLDKPLDPEVLKEFASLDSYAIILGWIEDVILKEKEYKALFSREGETERLFTEDKNNTFTPTILFQKGAVAALHLQFWSLQNAIRLAFDKKQTMTSGFLLKELIDLKNESIGTIIHKAYNNHHLPDAKKRLQESTSRTSEKSLTSIQYHEALGIDPSIKQIEKGEYSPEEAREEFLATALNSESRYATVKENPNCITIQAQFKRLNNDPVREEKVLQALTQKFKRMPKDIPITLIFNDSHIMTSDFLAPFLHENVENLELTNCPTLKNDAINLLQEKCSKLKKISLTSCTGITEISGTYWSPLLHFPKLEELDVSDCIRLQSLKLDVPLLETLKFKNSSNLKIFEDKKLLLMAIKQNIEAFERANATLKQDREFVLAAVKQDGRVLEYVADYLKGDKRIVLTAIEQNGRALQYANAGLNWNRSFVHMAVERNATALEYAREEFKGDRAFVLEAVRQNIAVLEYADLKVKMDKFFILSAIRQNAATFEYAHAKFKKDKEFVLDAVNADVSAFQYADEALKKDRGFVLDAMTQNCFAFQYADESLKKDKEVVLYAVNKNSSTLQYADESLKKDKDFILDAVKQHGWALQYADESLKKDKEVVLAAVRQYDLALQYADDSLKKDKEIVLAAITREDRALQYADESLKKDRDFILAAVKQHGWAFQYADKSLKKDRDFILDAVKQHGWALFYTDKSLKKDKEIVLAAVKQYGWALQYADESLKKDKEIILAAVTQEDRALQYADESLKKDRGFVLDAVTQNGLALEYADKSLKKDKEVVLAAVKQNGCVLEYVDKCLKQDKEVVLAAIKQNSKALLYAHCSIKNEVRQEMEETNEKLTRAFVQFSLGFNDQNSSHKDLPKEAIHNILIYCKSQLY